MNIDGLSILNKNFTHMSLFHRDDFLHQTNKSSSWLESTQLSFICKIASIEESLVVDAYWDDSDIVRVLFQICVSLEHVLHHVIWVERLLDFAVTWADFVLETSCDAVVADHFFDESLINVIDVLVGVCF